MVGIIRRPSGGLRVINDLLAGNQGWDVFYDDVFIGF
jgi:hypothetical protein